MEYNLKTQIIGESNMEAPMELAFSYEFESPEEAVLIKKGRLFITLSIKVSKAGFDLKSATKLFLEEVKEEYYKQTDDTPLHAIEKALNKAHGNLLSTLNSSDQSTLGSPENNSQIAIATALIWNSVMYTSSLGNAAVYLIRGTGTRNLNSNSNLTELWTNSSIVTNADVIIIGTVAFNEEFGGNNITENLGALSSLINKSPRRDEISAILIKVEAENKKKYKETTNIGDPNKIRNTFSSRLIRIKGYFSDGTGLSDKFKVYQNKKTAPVSSINSLLSSSPQLDVGSKIKPKRIQKIKKSHNRQKRVIVGLFMLLGFIYFNLRLFGGDSVSKIENDINSQIAHSNLSNSEVKGDQNVASLHSTFLNLNHISETIIPIDLDTLPKNSLFVLSNNSLYKVDSTTKESKEIYKGIDKGEYLKCTSDQQKPLCFIFSGQMLHVLDPTNPEKVDKYLLELPNVIDISVLTNAVYFLTQDNIYKLVLLDKEPTKWLAEKETIDANPIAFTSDNTSLFVLSGRNVVKYTQGARDSIFKLEDNSNLISPSKMEINGNNLYILNNPQGTSSSIAVYDKKTGKYIQNVILTDSTDPEIPALFTISKDDSSIVYRKGSSLYQVEKQTNVTSN